LGIGWGIYKWYEDKENGEQPITERRTFQKDGKMVKKQDQGWTDGEETGSRMERW
jgi:hypothetical protein